MKTADNQNDVLLRIEDHEDVLISLARSASFHRRFNTALEVAIILMVCVNFWRSLIVAQSVKQDYELSVKNASAISEVKAKQDLYRQQYIDYIKDMISTMNQLQKDNPNIRVPKAPVLRSFDADVAAEELRRIPQPGPIPTPIAKKEVIVKKVRAKAKAAPTPKPWYKYFDSTR